jgi:transposase InsO family protein
VTRYHNFYVIFVGDSYVKLPISSRAAPSRFKNLGVDRLPIEPVRRRVRRHDQLHAMHVDRNAVAPRGTWSQSARREDLPHQMPQDSSRFFHGFEARFRVLLQV